MIYLDNSATGGHKISAVIDLVNNVNKYLCANPGRSGHKLSTKGLDLVYSARELFSSAFSCPTEKVIFTKNCTEALNLAILGAKINKPLVLTTVYEHNSVLRPLYYLRNTNKIQLKIIEPKPCADIYTQIKNELNENVGMVVTTAVSNVTGDVLPVNKIGNLLKSHGVFYVVDGAQAGGHIPLSLEKDNISALCFAGHKGFYGLMGTGVLLLNENADVNPLLYGGTGDYTLLETQPDSYPEKLEAGTINLSGVASLLEGARYAIDNVNRFGEYLYSLTEKTIDGLNLISGVKCYSNPNPAGIVSFSVYNLSSMQVAERLDTEFDIAVRGGLHCAPLAHKHLGTLETGLVRASFSPNNQSSEARALLLAVKKIADSVKG